MTKQTNHTNKPPVSKAGYSKPWTPPCHTDGTLVFESDGVQFYAGKYGHVSNETYDLIIDLSGSVTSKVKGVNLPTKLKKFAEKFAAAILTISWPDYGIIGWEQEDYLKLLAAIKQDKIKSVYVCCIGGHGRTGTMMSILASLSGAVPDGQCPVTWLRKVYCDSVVESDGQLTYVSKVTGVSVIAGPSKGAALFYEPGKVGGWQKNVYGGGKVGGLVPKKSQYDGKYAKPN